MKQKLTSLLDGYCINKRFCITFAFNVLKVAHCSWTFNCRKVVQQQIWGAVIDFIPAFSAVLSENAAVKELLKLVYVCSCKNKNSTFFIDHNVCLMYGA